MSAVPCGGRMPLSTMLVVEFDAAIFEKANETVPMVQA
jgi:hypothetical protein